MSSRYKKMGNDKYAKIVFLWSWRKSKMWGKRFLLTKREGLKMGRLESQPVPIIHRERLESRLLDARLLESRRFIAAVM